MTLKQTLSFAVASISMITGLSAMATPPPPGSTDQRSVVLRQRYVNSRIQLRQLLGIDNRFDGYSIDSVVVDVHGSTANTRMDLLINNQIQESAYTPVGRMTFHPLKPVVFGNGVRDAQTLDLGIAGLSDIDAVTLNMKRPGTSPVQISVPLNIFKRMYGNDRIDLNQYLDLTQYQGMRVVSMDIVGRANAGNALLDIVIGSRNSTQGISLSETQQTFTVNLQDVVIGTAEDFVSLLNNGDLNIDTVTLKLAH
jgi:hypothetical protein